MLRDLLPDRPRLPDLRRLFRWRSLFFLDLLGDRRGGGCCCWSGDSPPKLVMNSTGRSSSSLSEPEPLSLLRLRLQDRDLGSTA